MEIPGKNLAIEHFLQDICYSRCCCCYYYYNLKQLQLQLHSSLAGRSVGRSFVRLSFRSMWRACICISPKSGYYLCAQNLARLVLISFPSDSWRDTRIFVKLVKFSELHTQTRKSTIANTHTHTHMGLMCEFPVQWCRTIFGHTSSCACSSKSWNNITTNSTGSEGKKRKREDRQFESDHAIYIYSKNIRSNVTSLIQEFWVKIEVLGCFFL